MTAIITGQRAMGELRDLKPLAARLNAATDELSATIRSIEERLNALGLGVEVWLTSQEDWLHSSLERSEGDGDGRTWAVAELGYVRFTDGWHLAVRWGSYAADLEEQGYGRSTWEPDLTSFDLEEQKPLLNASRRDRVAAVGRISALVDALKSASNDVIAAVEQAKQIAASLE